VISDRKSGVKLNRSYTMAKEKKRTKKELPVSTFLWTKPSKDDRERYIDDWDEEEKYCVDLTQWKETEGSCKDLEDLSAILKTLRKDTEVTLGVDVTDIVTFYACEGTLGDRTIPEVIRSPVTSMTIKGAISVDDLLKVINDKAVNFMGDFSFKLFPYRERKTGVIENSFRMCGPDLENLCETYERVDGELNRGKPLTTTEFATYQPGLPEETLGIWWSGPECLKLIINKELVAHTLATGKKPSEGLNSKIEKQISVNTQVNTENTKMKTTLMIEGKKKLSIEIGYDDLSSIVSSLPDSPDFEEVFYVLAAHPSATVRESVAAKDKINEETVNILASDSDAVVIRALVRSDAARETLTTEQLIKMIKRDVDTAENIAGYVESYNSAEADDIAEALAQHSDPRVRNAVAGNLGSPKKILKNLLKDEDPRVRASAKQSLE